jgi:acyl carrier protein
VTTVERKTLEDSIRAILREVGRLSVDPADLDDREDLFAAGMTSHSSVNLMLALEETFDLEFPESMLRKHTFESVGAIADALTSLTEVEVTSP